MKYTISQDRKRLTITANSNERAELSRQAKSSGIQSDEAMYDWFESLVRNSELDWINPADTHDLTDAPMLGILGEERPFNEEDKTISHVVTGPNLIQEITERWWFPDYQVRSVLEDLRDRGEVIFVNGN